VRALSTNFGHTPIPDDLSIKGYSRNWIFEHPDGQNGLRPNDAKGFGRTTPAADFVFFARRGEMVSNRPKDHEISMLALHLIQNCMVYINTLMIQKVLAQPHWHGRLTPRDYAALTPLIWEHVNPYGRFDLDMNARLALL
jgi:hypothetical protein